MENWKEIKDTGWKVSDLGHIMTPNGVISRFRTKGYSETKYGYVHRIVAYYFCNPPCEANEKWVCEGYAVHHINGDPTDNRAENLKYLTHEEHKRVHLIKKKKDYKKKGTPISKELITTFLNSLRA